jgi:hypothetical protein
MDDPFRGYVLDVARTSKLSHCPIVTSLFVAGEDKKFQQKRETVMLCVSSLMRDYPSVFRDDARIIELPSLIQLEGDVILKWLRNDRDISND